MKHEAWTGSAGRTLPVQRHATLRQKIVRPDSRRDCDHGPLRPFEGRAIQVFDLEARSPALALGLVLGLGAERFEAMLSGELSVVLAQRGGPFVQRLAARTRVAPDIEHCQILLRLATRAVKALLRRGQRRHIGAVARTDLVGQDGAELILTSSPAKFESGRAGRHGRSRRPIPFLASRGGMKAGG